VGRPLRLGEVRGFEFIDAEGLKSRAFKAGVEKWNMFVGGPGQRLLIDQTPVGLCANCGGLAKDHTRDSWGLQKPEYYFFSEEEKELVCQRCLDEEERGETETAGLELVERKLGLSEKDRDALKSFIETVFSDPKKILKMQELENRVSGLERQIIALWIALGVVGALLSIVAAIAIGG
jgi:hypothetical protein